MKHKPLSATDRLILILEDLLEENMVPRSQASRVVLIEKFARKIRRLQLAELRKACRAG